MNERPSNPLTPALAAGGALLLFVSLLLNWHSLDVKGTGQNLSIGVARPDGGTVLLAIAIAGALLIALGRFRGFLSGKSDLLTLIGIAAFAYVVVNIVKKPQLVDVTQSAFDEVQKRGGTQFGGADLSTGLGPGIWIALAGSLLLLAAGLIELLGSGARRSRRAGRRGDTGSIGDGNGPATAVAGGEVPARPGATSLGTPTPAAAPASSGGGVAPAPGDRTPAWHPDPYGHATHRWWDGTGWSEHTA